MFSIAFPCDYFNPTKADEYFTEQALACKKIDLHCAAINLETLNSLSKISIGQSNRILYRGWMRTKEEYQALYVAFKEQGISMMIDPQEYIQSHHLPNWYETIKDLTPQTVIFEYDGQLEGNIEALGWSHYFIKDYVKSLSTKQAPIVQSTEELKSLLVYMKQYRGSIEGGICVRKIEDLLVETEERYFVINGIAYGRTGVVPDIVKTCANRLNQLFFTVDVCQNSKGQDRVVEIGDGQVSDLKKWTADEFYHMIQSAHWERTI